MSTNSRFSIINTGARTGDFTTPDPITLVGANLVLYLEVTVASGTGGLVPRFLARTLGLTQFQLNEDPDPVTATGVYAYYFAPGTFAPGLSSATVKQIIRAPCPPVLDIQIHHLDGSSYTYRADLTNS